MSIERLKEKYGMTTLVICITYAIMFARHYNVDTIYAIMNSSAYGTGNLDLGRYGCEIVYRTLIFLGINYVKCFPFLILLMIFSFSYFAGAVSDCMVQKLDGENRKIRALLIRVAILIMVCNCFMQEWFAFWECSFQWSFSILCLTWALLKIGGKITLKNALFSCLFLVLGFGFYQGILSLFLICALSIVYFNHKGELTARSVIESFAVFAIGGIAGIVNWASIFLFQKIGWADITARTEHLSVDTIWNNIRGTIKLLIGLFTWTCGFFPKYGVFICDCILIGIIIWLVFSKKSNIVDKGIYSGGVWIASLLSAFIPLLIATSFTPAQRIIVGFWGNVSALLIIVATLLREKKVKKLGSVSVIIGITILVVNIVVIQSLEYELMASNKMDQEIARTIELKIEQYEEQSGNIVKKIAMTHDETKTRRYSFVKHDWQDTNVSAFSKDWSNVNCINFYNDTDYDEIDMESDIYEKYFLDKDWNYFNPEEQLVFEDDTLYMVWY